MIMNIKQRKIQIEPKTKLNYNTCIVTKECKLVGVEELRKRRLRSQRNRTRSERKEKRRCQENSKNKRRCL